MKILKSKNSKFFLCLLLSTMGAEALALNLAAPLLSGIQSSRTTIDIDVIAGNTGCAAGFSLHWQSQESYLANGNLFGSTGDGNYCAASFSGVPGYNQGGGTKYSLDPNQSAIIRVGDILIDQGASTGCSENLVCNTNYVFRAFCHAVPKGLKKSDLSPTIHLSTAPCQRENACTLSQGFWKTHSARGPASAKRIVDGIWDGTYISEYPVAGVSLGNRYYLENELVDILRTVGTRGNGLPALAHQLIAIKLDIARGTDASEIASIINEADGMIGNLIPGVDYLASSQTSRLTTAIDTFIQAHHCP